MPRAENSWTFTAIGTSWSLTSENTLTPQDRDSITRLCDRFDETWSRFRPDSRIRELEAHGGTVELPAESGRLAELYRVVYDATQGAVSPFVGRSISRLGYDADYSLRQLGDPIPTISWDQSVSWSGTRLSLPAGESLDIGAAGKGELIDQLTELLRSLGHERFVVDGSGDLRVVNAMDAPLRIGLAQPGSPGFAIGVAELGAGALCASASDKRRWSDDLHHVLDARTGLPTHTVSATWVVADTAAVADILATALFLAPAKLLSGVAPFEYVRLFSTGHAEVSAGFPGKVHT